MRTLVVSISIIICISYLADKPELTINPAGFESVNFNGNQYFPLKPGTFRSYEGRSEDGVLLRYDETVTSRIKNIIGISCREVVAKVYENTEHVFEIRKWYATDKKANVWQFGQESRKIENGKVIGIDGSWQAGLNELRPFISVWANPRNDFVHQQKFSPKETHERAQVFSLATNISVPFGDFKNCLRVAEWNAGEPDVTKCKYYAPGVGLVKVIVTAGGSDYMSTKQSELNLITMNRKGANSRLVQN